MDEFQTQSLTAADVLEFAKAIKTPTETVKPEPVKPVYRGEIAGRVYNPELWDFIADNLEMVFPGQWDLKRINERFYAYVHFPAFTIKNSRGDTHDITDLFVRMAFRQDARMYGGLHGSRGSYTENENRYGYAHSHISGMHTLPSFESFCLGASELGAQEAELRTEDIRTNPIAFECYLATIDAFVRWESLEGTPYRYMYKINSSEGSQSNWPRYNGGYLDNTEVLRQFIKELELQNHLLSIDVVDGTLILPSSTNLLNILDLSKCTEEFKRVHAVFQADSGRRYSYLDYVAEMESRKNVNANTEPRTEIVDEGNSGFTFREKPWRYKIYRTILQNNTPLTGTLRVHPDFYSAIERSLNNGRGKSKEKKLLNFKYL